MSNLSLARIMYGATQENSSYTLTPISNFPSNLSSVSSGTSFYASASSLNASVESLLHKAWLALTRHN